MEAEHRRNMHSSSQTPSAQDCNKGLYAGSTHMTASHVLCSHFISKAFQKAATQSPSRSHCTKRSSPSSRTVHLQSAPAVAFLDQGWSHRVARMLRGCVHEYSL
eukprot:354574-Chlamydomonas_euryale.AAC.12